MRKAGDTSAPPAPTDLAPLVLGVVTRVVLFLLSRGKKVTVTCEGQVTVTLTAFCTGQ